LKEYIILFYFLACSNNRIRIGHGTTHLLLLALARVALGSRHQTGNMDRRGVFAFISVLIVLVYCHEDTYSVSHTSESFNADVTKSKHFVMFFAPW